MKHRAYHSGISECGVLVKDRPVSAGEVHELSITGFNQNGEGIGRVDGLAVFVPKAIPGERVLARITEVRSRFARAQLERIEAASVHRVRPRCPQAGTCGGCQLQHISYDRQLALKRELVEETLKRIGHIEHPVLPAIGMDIPWRYRNKGHFHLRKTNNRISFGFFAPGSHHFIPARDCLLFSTAVNNLLSYLEDQFTAAGVEVFHAKTRDGYLRNVVVRESMATGEMMVILVTAHDRWKFRDLADDIGKAFPQVVSIYQNINSNTTPVILGNDFKLLKGEAVIRDTIGHLVFNLSPRSFFQVNSVQTKALYQVVRDYAGLTGRETLADTYCGVGTIALFLANQAQKVYGVELVASAVRDAEANARLNGIRNVRFVAARVEDWVRREAKQGGRIDVLIVDPPRRGLSPDFLQSVSELLPPRMIYVSCNPATLARDLVHLVEHGYAVTSVQPVDMFPQTGHVETVVLMSRVENGVSEKA